MIFLATNPAARPGCLSRPDSEPFVDAHVLMGGHAWSDRGPYPRCRFDRAYGPGPRSRSYPRIRPSRWVRRERSAKSALRGLLVPPRNQNRFLILDSIRADPWAKQNRRRMVLQQSSAQKA